MSTEIIRIPVDSDLYDRLIRAAELEGSSINDFLVLALQDAAMRALDQSDIIKLTPTGQQRVAQSLLHPPQPTPALRRAFARRHQLLREK